MAIRFGCAQPLHFQAREGPPHALRRADLD